MANKSKDIKNYLSTVGKTEQLHVFVGYTNETVNNSTNDAAIKIWQDMLFSKKISRGDVVGVIPNQTWTYGNVYYPWKSNVDNSGAYYAWNKQNGNVYLCVQNNINARSDESGKNASTYIPSHAYGIQSYADGYSWMPIYRITSEYLRFVKNNWIPVISFEDFELYTEATEYQNASSFCGVSDITTNGKCAIYSKDTIKIAKNPVVFESYTKGQFIASLSMNCQLCYSFFKDNNQFEARFYEGTPPNSITIESKLQLIGRLISENKLPASSAFYALYDIAVNGLSDGAVISSQIDLSGFATSDLYTTTDNPVITVSSYTGSGASIRLLTYKSLQGKYVIKGVEILTNGSGYKDISLDISSSILETPAIKDILLSAISVNYDIIDGLNVDPYDVLNCKNIQIDTRLDITDINSNSLLVPDEINMYSLVSNPLEQTGTGDFIVSGSDLSRYTSKVKIGYTTLAVAYPGDVFSKSFIPKSGNATVNDAANTVVSEPKILKNFASVSGYSPTVVESLITVNNFDYSNISKSSKITDSDSRSFNITKIIDEPTFKQYSGKILQTVKTTKNLKLSSSSGELSKVLRINMIKGV
jgi:hypothetical protein